MKKSNCFPNNGVTKSNSIFEKAKEKINIKLKYENIPIVPELGIIIVCKGVCALRGYFGPPLERRCNKVHFHWFSKGKCSKCIRMWITYSKCSFGEVYLRIFDEKSCFTAPLA